DDPARAARALDVRGALLRTARMRENVALARQASDTQAAALEEVSDLVAQARAKIEDAASGTKTQGELDVLAGEIDAVLEQLVAVANRNQEGRYVFAGSEVKTQPFQTTKGSQGITGVAYAGDDIVRQVQLGPGELKDMELSGLDVFFQVHRGATKFTDSTGVAAVPGAADTMVGSAKLLLAHTGTTLGDASGPGGADGASGLAHGASVADDTILGDHTVTVGLDPVSGARTLSLDGGPAVEVDGTETDLALQNQAGDVVHLDVTNLGASFTGDVTVSGQGTIQVEGGPATALNFGSDQSLKDAEGRTVHVDTTGVRRAGEDLAVFPGTTSIFQTLIEVRDDLRAKGGFDPSEIVARSVTRLASLDRNRDDLLKSLAERQEQVDTQRELQAKIDPWFNVLKGVKAVMPKTQETIGLLDRELLHEGEVGLMDILNGNVKQTADGRFVVADYDEERATQANAVEYYRSQSMWYILGTSFGFEAVMLGLACFFFVRRDF
ncbi:MAG: hypothetical protein KC983_05830, partial [Phycisphaerales bacterium]|nr:hypothetical protein [Phycisphaerales bacterium]